MASNVLDSVLFRDSFGTPEMRAIFDDRELIRKYVEVEIALANAQARCGVIPEGAAAEITASCNADTLDFELLRHETEIVGYPILPLVHQISKQAGQSGGYVHWGATTQDIMDTAVVLQIRDAFALIEADIDALRSILAGLAARYRNTPMAGRTHLQQALPITFGYKAAIWLDMFDRHAERLAQMRPRVLVGEFAGAAGTLASLGDKGLAVQKALMAELGLGVPTSTWHVARDGFAEAVNLLAVITGSLGKIGYDVMLMASNEFGELYEPFVKGRGASSTMPQKRNPISSELMLACSKGVRQQAGLMLDAMVQDLERATGPWHAEWIAIPESFILSAGALHQAKFMLNGLIVDEKMMLKNLNMTNGLIVAEAVMMGLAPYIGRQEAHDIVYDACRIVNEKGGTLADVLNAMPGVSSRLDPKLIEDLTNPVNYLGSAPEMVDQVLNKTERK
ncbi:MULTISPECIES: class-II fumarase/aspartase family protein [Pectobacterium]|uniref:class-II fumarase/aspartase family protein n=1 Tax=Pectobacterium TaxID=122277 RepID=UPI00057DECC8|nr:MULTISPECIES: adenylosuccinate lyase family protein [Pectobacterium]KHT28595.1 3-carboxy-cis,cis-muconate cycloisomerase [Pectobacterium carotovorum subsp. carotovorum]KHT33348.1 3-carboxy-cis,cis-muconate cycloisomerase [Pectobacterium carotovorum subsp. carotovorum]MBL0868769.1 adenylosuccinate lyase family protein [Pectobacterium carotovorum]MBL0910419.1 adenylosuccinate lyase family protein [Pectobacterium carotovorum]ULS50770.1 adenylosuccinate lyase family protein [Pectobacterium caro